MSFRENTDHVKLASADFKSCFGSISAFNVVILTHLFTQTHCVEKHLMMTEETASSEMN